MQFFTGLIGPYFFNLWTVVNSWKCGLLMLRFYDIKFCSNVVESIFWNNLVVVNFMHARGGALVFFGGGGGCNLIFIRMLLLVYLLLFFAPEFVVFTIM